MGLLLSIGGLSLSKHSAFSYLHNLCLSMYRACSCLFGFSVRKNRPLISLSDLYINLRKSLVNESTLPCGVHFLCRQLFFQRPQLLLEISVYQFYVLKMRKLRQV